MRSLLLLFVSSTLMFKSNSGKLPAAGSPVVHFEIGCRDLKRTTAFYATVFGWSSTDAPMSSILNTLSTDGIQGHITSLGHEPFNYTTFYVQVEDINQKLADITKAGGKKIVGPITLPDKRQFAWISDPEGNVVGIITH